MSADQMPSLKLGQRQTTVQTPSGARLAVITDWYCPNCGRIDQTREVRPHQRLHPCPKLAGMSAPMLPVGTKAKVYTKEREDYVGSDLIRTDENGRAIMSVVTEREDGQDAIVFAPTAVMRAKEL